MQSKVQTLENSWHNLQCMHLCTFLSHIGQTCFSSRETTLRPVIQLRLQDLMHRSILPSFQFKYYSFRSDQVRSVAQSCPTLCDPMNRSTPGLPVHHQLPEFTQTQVHRVSDAIQPSHPLASPSPPAPNPSQHQSLFQ